MKRLGLSLAFLVACVVHGAAAEPRNWTIDAEASSLDVVYIINGDERRGFFERFDGAGRFDVDALENADLDFFVEMESIDVGDAFGTFIIKTDDWFGAFENPEGRFSLISLTPSEDGAFRFTGDLTLKGITRTIEGDLSLNIDDETALATGRTEFDRSLFNIGVGFTALFVEVGDRVAVEFKIIAAPAEE